ncbi:MAG: TlpA family protein disulfide reductase, partial [Bacteroidales bacterium]|nr:TlpA family protein disulfide reductase [Bacteroidales bacterium]
EDLDKQAQEIIGGINSYTKEYIDANLTSMVSMIALYQQVVPGVYVINPEEDIDYFIKVDSTLFSLYPESEPVKYFHEQISQLITSMGARNADIAIFEEGGEAPDFTLPDRDGNPVSLSSTRGKVVLLDFWAAWCPPCRTENPNLVNAYERINEKGFDIFQVSLDQTREAWLKGIEEDNLGQWHHVSDLKYWQSMVVPLYRIQGIPTSFLLDRDGKIIGSNLRGSALVSKLEEIFE